MADKHDHQLNLPQSTNCKDTEDGHSDPLTYPQLLLETSFKSLLINSYISESSSRNNMRDSLAPRPPASLSESWASISDNELSQDDDLRSEQTDVGSLIDIRSAEDILSVQEEDAATSDGESDADAMPPNEVYASQLRSSDHLTTTGTSLTETSLLPDHLTLDEPEQSSTKDAVLVRHVLKHFDETEATQLAGDSPSRPEDVVGTICLNLHRSSLRDSGRQSLHLLILGKDYFPSLRTSIVGKVADALVAVGSASDFSRPSSPSRYHIVPDCFGPGSMPTAAEVIPIDCQLEVDSFHSAEFLDQTHQMIRLEDASSARVLLSSRHEDGYALSGDKRGKPDLAVVVVSSEDTSTDIDRTCVMLIFAQRHSIPVLVIAVDENWGAESLPLEQTGLSARRYIENITASGNGACRELPLDLDTFIRLNPAQLSRHLAYLIEASRDEPMDEPHLAIARTAVNSSQDSLGKGSDLFDALPSLAHIKKAASRVGPWFITFLGAVLLAQVIVSLSAWQTTPRSSLSMTDPAAPTTSEGLLNFSTKTNVSKPTSAAQTALATPAVPLTIDATKSLAGSFEVEVVGNSHLIVRTPSQANKRGSVIVTVLKEGKPLNAEAKLLFPCVYSVYITEEEMYGNVTVQLEIAKPRSVDSVTINLGPQPLDLWLRGVFEGIDRKLLAKLARFRAAVNNLVGVDEHLKEVPPDQSLLSALAKAAQQYEQLYRPLRARVARLERHVQAWNERVDTQGAEVLRHARFASADMLDKMVKQVRQARQASPWLQPVSLSQLPKLPKLPNPMSALQHAIKKREVRQRLQQAAHNLHDRAQSDTLATAQDRAQQIMEILRQRRGEGRS